MSLSPDEVLLAEAFKGYLASGSKLGLSGHSAAHDKAGSQERGLEHLHGQIDELFRLKTTELTHHTGICAAFSKVHGYKYIDDPKFNEAMTREMLSQGIPSDEREQAIKFIPQIIEELQAEQAAWSEKDFGFHPDLDDLMKIPGGE